MDNTQDIKLLKTNSEHNISKKVTKKFAPTFPTLPTPLP